MNLWHRFSVVASVLVLANCSKPTSDDLIAKAQSAFQQYTTKAPGTTLVTGLLTTPPLAETYAEDVRALQVSLAQEMANLQDESATVDVLDRIDALSNALTLVATINTALDNPPPELPATPSAATRNFLKALRAVERSKYELVGEQVVAGIVPPVTPATAPGPGELTNIHDKLLFEANKARANGEVTRADLIRIDAVTLGNYAQEVGTDPSVQIVPIPSPTAEVPDVFSEEGIIASSAQALRHERKTIDSDTRFLPTECDNTVLDEDTCPIEPVVVLTPQDAVETYNPSSGLPADLPADLAAATNTIISKVNAVVAEFIDTPHGGPVASTLPSQVATLEIEAAQLLAYLNLVKDTPVTREFIARLEKVQTLDVLLASLLNVASPVDPFAFATPDLNGLNLTQIPAEPLSTQSTMAFLDTRRNPITIQDALVEGTLRAAKAAYEIVGENILSLHPLTTATVPAPAPTQAQITAILKNYEETAINADNNGEPDRAVLLRMIATGYSLTTVTPAALPLPTATPAIPDTRSQAGYPASIAQRADQRRMDIDVNNASVPPECDDRTWDSDTCPLSP